MDMLSWSGISVAYNASMTGGLDELWKIVALVRVMKFLHRSEWQPSGRMDPEAIERELRSSHD